MIASHGKKGSTSLVLLGLIVIVVIALYVADNKPPLGAVNAERLWTFDHPFNLYWGVMGRKFIETDGGIWGLDPAFMAGYPLSFLENSCLFLQMIFAAMPWANPIILYKLILIAIIAFAPVAIYASARNFKLPPPTALAAAFMAAVYARTGLWLLLFYGGGISQSLMLIMFVYTLSVFYRWLGNPGAHNAILSAAMLIIMTLAHRGAIYLFPAFALAALLARGRDLFRGRALPQLILMVLVLAGINLVWIVPMMNFISYKVPLPFALLQNFDALKPVKDFLTPMQGFEGLMRSNFYGTMITHFALGAGAAFGLRWSPANRSRKRFLLAALGYVFFLGYFGSFFSLTAISEPYRHTAAMFLLLCIPAALGWGRIFAAVSSRLKLKPKTRALAPALGIAALSLTVLLPSYHNFALQNSPRTTGGANFREIETWISKYTNPSARVFVEDATYNDKIPIKLNPYENSYPLAYLPLTAGRSLIGGPSSFYTIRHHYATFQDGMLIGKFINGKLEGAQLSTISEKGLDAALDKFNAGWVIGWSERAYLALNNERERDRMTFVTGGDVFKFYKIKDPAGFFEKGSGEFWAAPNRVMVDNAVDQDGEIILKLHYIKGMKTSPPLDLAPAPNSDEAEEPDISFILVKNPPERFIIYNGFAF